MLIINDWMLTWRSVFLVMYGLWWIWLLLNTQTFIILFGQIANDIINRKAEAFCQEVNVSRNDNSVETRPQTTNLAGTRISIKNKVWINTSPAFNTSSQSTDGQWDFSTCFFNLFKVICSFVYFQSLWKMPQKHHYKGSNNPWEGECTIASQIHNNFTKFDKLQSLN